MIDTKESQKNLAKLIEKKWSLNLTKDTNLERHFEKNLKENFENLVSKTNKYLEEKVSNSTNSTKINIKEKNVQKKVELNNFNIVNTKKSNFEKYFEKYFSSVDYCFINIKSLSKSINIFLLEKLNQKILIGINEKNIFFSEKTFIYLLLYYMYTERNYEGIRLIKTYIHMFKYPYIFYHLLGNFYYKLGEKDKSEKYFKLSIDEMCNSKFLIIPIYSNYFSLAYIYTKNGDYLLALELLNKAKISFKKNPNWIKLFADCLEKNNQKEKAFRYYTFLFEKYVKNKVKKNVDIIKKILLLAFSLKNSKVFLYYLLIVKENNLNFKNIHYMEILIHLMDDDEEKAFLVLKSISFTDNFKLQSNFFDFLSHNLKNQKIILLVKYILINLSRHIFFQETFIILEKYCKKIKYPFSQFLEEEINIDFISDFNVLLQIAEYGKTYNHKILATIYIKKALKINPNSRKAKILLTKLNYLHNSNDKRVKDLLLDLENHNYIDNEIAFYLGKHYFNDSNYLKSIKFLKISIQKKFTDLFNVFFLLGKNYIKLNNYKKALYYLKKANKIKNSNFRVKFYLGVVYKNLNFLKKSLFLFKVVLKNDPDNKEAHLYLSEVYKLILKNKADKHYSIYLNKNNN